MLASLITIIFMLRLNELKLIRVLKYVQS